MCDDDDDENEAGDDDVKTYLFCVDVDEDVMYCGVQVVC